MVKKKSRRIFLQIIVSGIATLFLFLWNKLTFNHLQNELPKTKIYPYNKNKPVSFFENVIVINGNDETTVLSAKCSHLGCTINRFENGRLVCPCHGSEYDLQGKAVKGPAFKNLEKLPAVIVNSGTQIEIKS